MKTIFSSNFFKNWLTTWILLFAVSIWASKAGANVATGFIFLSFLIAIIHYQQNFLKDYLSHVTLLFIGYILLLSVLTSFTAWGPPLVWDKNLEVAFGILRGPLVLLAVAWAISASGTSSRALSLAFLIGLLLALPIATLIKGVDLQPILQGRRTQLNFGTQANDLGLFAGVGLALLLFLRPTFYLGENSQALKLILIYSFWFLALSCSIALLIASQSRGAWLAAILVLPAVGFMEIVIRRAKGRDLKGQDGFVISLLILPAVAFLLWGLNDFFLNRFAQESKTFQALLSGEIDKVPFSSFGQRIHMWNLGIEKWLAHPFLGNGPASGQFFLNNSGIEKISRHPHMHSLYIDTLSRTGLVGLGFIVALFYVYLSSLFHSVRKNPRTLNVALALFASLGIFLVHGGAQFLLTGNRPALLLAFLGGWAYSLHPKNKLKKSINRI